MDILLFNTGWMIFNIILAVLAVLFGLLVLKVEQKYLKYLILFLWLIFVPNTLYILTDIIHIPRQWSQLDFIKGLVMIFQYLMLEIAGLITFILAMHFFEKALKSLKFKNEKIKLWVIIINFIIGFGIVLGRIERINSWEIVTDPNKVITGTVNAISSVEMVILAVFFGIIGNLLYFLYKEKTIRLVGKYLKI